MFACFIDCFIPDDSVFAPPPQTLHLSQAAHQLLQKTPKLVGPILVGDLNAGKNYVPLNARKNMALFSSPDYVFGITNGTDTTVREGTDFTYDRIIWFKEDTDFIHLAGDGDGVWRWNKPLGICEEPDMLKISDHWAVEAWINV